MLRRIRNFLAVAALAAAPIATMLVPGVAHALPSAYCEWTGTFSTAWDDSANWTSVNSGCTGTSVNASGVATATPNTVPGTGDNLVFGNVAATSQPTNNNLTGLSVGSIDFEAVAAGQALGGNAFTLTGNVTNNTGSSDNIGNNVTISSASIMDMGNMAAINFGGTVDGSGNITKQGAGGIYFVGGFTNTGALTINAGTVSIVATTAAPTFSSVSVASGATFAFDAFLSSGLTTYAFTKDISSAGGSLDFFTNSSGTGLTLNITGTTTLTGDTEVNAGDNTTVHFQGPLHGPGFTLIAVGTSVISNDSSDNTTDTPSGVLGASTQSGSGGGATAPDTGSKLVASHPGVTLAVTIAAAGVLLAVARMTRKSASRR